MQTKSIRLLFNNKQMKILDHFVSVRKKSEDQKIIKSLLYDEF